MSKQPTDPRLPEAEGFLPSLQIKFLIAFLVFGVLPAIAVAMLLTANFQSMLNEALAMLHAHGVTQTQQLENMMNSFRMKEVVAIIVLIVLSPLGATITSRLFLRPIYKLVHGVSEVAKGNLAVVIKPEDNDEVGQLTQQFNVMTMRLREAREREALVAQAKSEFIAIAAHQLRTPLSGIKWSAQMLLDGDFGNLNEKQRSLVEEESKTVERMVLLISDLLNVARIEEGRFGFSFKKMDLGPLLKETVDEVGVVALKHNLTLALEIPKEKLPSVFVDPDRLKLAVSNLVGNAINYTPAGGRIIVGLRQEGNFLRVYVQDTGVGVPAEQMGKLFTKFFRAQNAVHIQTEGSGLGLFLVKSIVERHGGTVSAESVEGKGSTFSFTIPIRETEMPRQEASVEEFLQGI